MLITFPKLEADSWAYHSDLSELKAKITFGLTRGFWNLNWVATDEMDTLYISYGQ